jgi:hypothetical protein
MIARSLVALIGLTLIAAGAALGVMSGLVFLGLFIPDQVWSIARTLPYLADSIEGILAAPALAYLACRLGAALLSGSAEAWRLRRRGRPVELTGASAAALTAVDDKRRRLR